MARELQAVDRTLMSRLGNALAALDSKEYLSPKLVAKFANEDKEGERWVKKYSYTGRQIADAAYGLGWEQLKRTKWNPTTKTSERMYRFIGKPKDLTDADDPDAKPDNHLSGWDDALDQSNVVPLSEQRG